jgi:hypothetical protein
MQNDSTELDWYHFAQFANIYCHNNTADAQCAQMKNFVNGYRENTSVDKGSSVSGRSIQNSIKSGETQANNAMGTRFKQNLGSSAASVAAAATTDTDSKGTLIKREGVHLRGKFNPWSGNVCKIEIDDVPFTQYVFTAANENTPSVSVKYVMSSMDAKTFCALAKYAKEGSTLNERTINFSLISPSVTITLYLKKKEDEWDITTTFDSVYDAIKRDYAACEEPYTGSYEFYQEENPIIATLFFTKPPETVYDPIVYQRVIQRRIAACVDQIQLNMNLFEQNEVVTIVTQLEYFKKTLNEMKENPILEDLKKLDNEVNDYVRVTFQRLVQTKKKDQYQSLDSKISTMSLGASAAVP